MGLVSDLLSAIPVYTGLSATAFFTILALVFALYYIISGFFAAPRRSNYVAMEPLPAPVQLGDVTEEELLAYDGKDPSKPLLMAIKGQIYDVSQSRMFYGPGGPYALFAGKDASRALAKMSFDEKDLTGEIEGLSPYELDALQDWEWKFMSKYVKVGQILKEKTRDIPVTESSKKSEDHTGEALGKTRDILVEDSEVSKDQVDEAPETEINNDESGKDEHLEGSKE